MPQIVDRIRSLRDQCQRADIVLFPEQNGRWTPNAAGASSTDGRGTIAAAMLVSGNAAFLAFLYAL
jgi:hypothetical protein